MLTNPLNHKLKLSFIFFMACLLADFAQADYASFARPERQYFYAESTGEEIPSKSVSSPYEKQNRDSRFVRNKNGIVYDPRTGLEWLAGPDRDTSFTEAKNWAENLATGGGGWRLPTRAELRSLYSRKSGRAFLLPAWVAFPDSGIWTNHRRHQMIIDTTYYYFYRDGVEFTTSYVETFIDMRALSVRRKDAPDHNNEER